MPTNVTLKQLRAFIAVAQCGGFAEACDQLNISQPALSLSIKKLEELVGGTLFQRTTRALVLTPEGRVFLPKAKRLIAEMDFSVEQLSELYTLQRGLLNIAVMPSFASAKLAEHIQKYKKQHPDIAIKIFDIVAESAIEMVRTEQVELAITFEPSVQQELDFTPLFTDEFVAALPSGHELLAKTEITWSTLAAYAFIILQKPSSIRELIVQHLQPMNTELKIDIEVNQLQTVISLISADLGVSAIPNMLAQHIKQQGVEFRPLVEPVIYRNIGVVTHKHRPLSYAARAFLALLKIQTSSTAVKR